VSTEEKSTSIENAEPLSYADKVVQSALEKSKERKEMEKEDLSSQFEGVRDNFLKKAKELEEVAAAKKKQKELDEATPF